MKSSKNYLVVFCVFVFAVVPMLTIGQTPIGDRIIYPPEFSPLNTSRPWPEQRSLVPPTKFVKVQNAIPNRYIVVLNDDVVRRDDALNVRRAEITAIANGHARVHLGRIGFVYETALKGYSIELTNEAAAIAISQNPQVKWVEEVGRLQIQAHAIDGQDYQPEAFQSNPPWGLDAIDGSVPVAPVAANGTTNGIYVFNATGAAVTAFVLDAGIRRTHEEFGIPPFVSRAFIAADFIAYANGQSGPRSPYLDSCISNSDNNDCSGHGTHVAGTIGGATYGAAKAVTIRSVKVCTGNFYGCPTDVVNAGVNGVSNQHNANPSVPVVANMSLGADSRAAGGFVYDAAVTNSIAAGVTYCVAANNSNDDARFFTPADIPAALTVGAMDNSGSRAYFSNFGSRVDLFAPGQYIVSADRGSDTDMRIALGTSMASAHAAGAVAMYLQGRNGMTNCSAFPIQGPAPSIGGPISTCPDRVARFMDSNSNLNKLTNVNGVDSNGIFVTSANRLLWTGTLPTTTNPVDNQRFFVWQQYSDIGFGDPDEGGLDFWTQQITGPLGPNCNVGFNGNNSCTRSQRVLISHEFLRIFYPSAFNDNTQFLQRCYLAFLRRTADPGGLQFWLGILNQYGDPASAAGINALIDAFIYSAEYRQRFGQP